MDISVVVCTRNRARQLPQMLESLRHLRAPGILWEVIFVDNASSDGTAHILEEFCNNSSIPARVIYESKPGLAAARNTGWRASNATIVSFTDDDCYPQHDWLLMVHQAFQEAGIDYVGGRVLLFDAQDAPVTIQISEDRYIIEKNSHIESGYIIGANFACTRKMLLATGGFDIRLGAGTRIRSAEDTDLLVRASLSGFQGRYEPAIVVYHHHRRRPGPEVEKLNSGYACGRGALSMKTILESDAKKLYLKNWYWRIRRLVRDRKFDECLDELKGAVQFIAVSKFKKLG